jgi:hypothetical protein
VHAYANVVHSCRNFDAVRSPILKMIEANADSIYIKRSAAGRWKGLTRALGMVPSIGMSRGPVDLVILESALAFDY